MCTCHWTQPQDCWDSLSCSCSERQFFLLQENDFSNSAIVCVCLKMGDTPKVAMDEQKSRAQGGYSSVTAHTIPLGWKIRKYQKNSKAHRKNQKTCFLALKCPTLVCWPAVEIAKACSRYPRNIQKLFFPVLQKSQLIFHSTRKPLRGIQLIESELRAVAVTVLKTAPGLAISLSTGRNSGSECANVYLI